MNPVALLLLLFFSSVSLAATDTQIGKTYHQEVPNVQQTLEKSLNNLSHIPIKAEDYCKDATCKKDIAAPSLSHYINDSAALTQDSQHQLATDPNASNVTSSFNHRPKRPVNPNDPAYQNAKKYMDNSYNISHGLSNKYIDCEKGQVCEYMDTTRQCTKPTNNPIRCTLSYVIDHYQEQQKTATVPLVKNNARLWQFSLPQEATRLLSVHFPKINIFAFSQKHPLYGIPSLMRTLNQQSLPKLKGSRWNCMISGGHHSNGQDWNNYRCHSRLPADIQAISSTARQYSLQLAYPYTPQMNNVTLTYLYQTPVMTWRNSCGNAIPPNCSKTGTACSNGNCTEKQETWQCDSPNTCDAYLIPSRTVTDAPLTCVEKSQSCKTQILGVCLEYNVNLDCKERTCKKTNLQCGDTFFCLDGDCYQGKEQKNTGFNHSASALAGLGSAAASLKQDPFQVFTGKPAFCSKKPLGISDCCADKGWGQGLGLTQCSEEEKGLAQAKQKGLTIDLGQFCAEKVLGACIRKKKGYCLFDSKMARIVQQQGRPQLGINFGQAKSPQCQGLSPEQMQQLNFSTINFSEFYEDLHNNINMPDTNEVQRRIESKYKDLGGKQS
ncbi:type-F conjugative transfer system mating-pair stabilization protein TraN [Photobacterium phosphoreum]|uniref:type-F conjugative transfer system mating-pair stabilization protein TraN n=1 Tax=Photobacterium phosphoreum TaxID=659 RepID=UPI001E607C7D|nr:type-F conjugative transfer system mating-pair stabilization protein TraN [Photobacterium phosphoreum]